MHPQAPRRQSRRNIKEQLKSIYGNTSHARVDMSRLDQHRTSGLTKFLWRAIIILAILSIVAWSGFFLTHQSGLFSEDEALRVEITSAPETMSGAPGTFTIDYENTGSVPLASLSLKLHIPQTFHITSTIPPTQNNEWTLGALSPSSDGKITINGIFLSEVPSTERLQALFTYKPANFNSDFQKITTKNIDIQKSVLAQTLAGPEQALSGDESEYVINIQNTSNDPIYNIRVVPTLPKDFTVTHADPVMQEGEVFWQIDTLSPGEFKAITLQGEYTSTASGEQILKSTAGFVVDKIFLPQTSQEIHTDVLGGSVSFSLIVNGSNASQTSQAGDLLRATIDFSNASTQTIENLTFDLTVDGQGKTAPIDWKHADLAGGVQMGQSIHWDSTLPLLKTLSPQDHGTLDVNLPLLESLTSIHTDAFILKTQLTVQKIGDLVSTRILEATPITIALNSNANVSAQARYFSESGDPLGNGPIPPTVGESTTYRVYWNIHNSLHTMESLSTITTLPKNITWNSQSDTSIGTINFNEITRQVSCNIPKLPSEVPSANAWFDVTVTPTTSDAGHFAKLTNTTSFSGKDTITQKTVSNSLRELTTECGDDAFVKGKGAVQED